MPPNYNPVKSDDIELLTPGESSKKRHSRSGSTSSFIHFKAPQQKEEDANHNRLATQVRLSLYYYF
jgi:solute carrier family 41